MERRDKLIDLPFDTIAELEDKQVFMCGAPAGPWKDRQIGDVPVLCPSWAPMKDRTDALKAADDLVARSLARLESRASSKKGGDRE